MVAYKKLLSLRGSDSEDDAEVKGTRKYERLICSSLRSMAVLSSRAHERRSREIRARSARERAAKPREKEEVFQLLPPQSPRGFSALARLYYLATKTAMLRRQDL